MTDKTEPPGDGWKPFLEPGFQAIRRLEAGQTLEIWRREWGNDTSFLQRDDLRPETNVMGLWWRPA
jgi:hypothetical protein